MAPQPWWTLLKYFQIFRIIAIMLLLRYYRGVGQGEGRKGVGERRKMMGRKEIKDKGENEETKKTRFVIKKMI